MNNMSNKASRHLTGPEDNIFSDLGFPPEKAQQLQQQSDSEIAQLLAMKRAAMSEIASWMSEQDIKQRQAAELMGVSRPRISDVVNQKTEKFTLDALIPMLGAIGKRVRLVIE